MPYTKNNREDNLEKMEADINTNFLDFNQTHDNEYGNLKKNQNKNQNKNLPVINYKYIYIYLYIKFIINLFKI